MKAASPPAASHPVPALAKRCLQTGIATQSGAKTGKAGPNIDARHGNGYRQQPVWRDSGLGNHNEVSSTSVGAERSRIQE
jgi:hypothetical protein